MGVCGECVIIPNNYKKFTIVYKINRDTCCKCKEYKHLVQKILIDN